VRAPTGSNRSEIPARKVSRPKPSLGCCSLPIAVSPESLLLRIAAFQIIIILNLII
jgi:hypothetical protein